jgi:hypothetical protein
MSGLLSPHQNFRGTKALDDLMEYRAIRTLALHYFSKVFSDGNSESGCCDG